jgi:hypothetical protein
MSSTIGTRKVNKKGRSTGRLKSHTRLQIIGQFVHHTREMLESPAWRVLSHSALRLLSRIEIEHLKHGGVENGRLPVTFDDFEEYGIHRHSIAPAIRECEALGFIEITQRGVAANAEFRSPHYYRLTYLNALAREPATHEWREIATKEEADMRARFARNTRAEKQKPSGGKRQLPVAEFTTETHGLPVAESTTTVSVRNPPLLSISWEETPAWGTPTLTEMSWAEYLQLSCPLVSRPTSIH